MPPTIRTHRQIRPPCPPASLVILCNAVSAAVRLATRPIPRSSRGSVGRPERRRKDGRWSRPCPLRVGCVPDQVLPSAPLGRDALWPAPSTCRNGCPQPTWGFAGGSSALRVVVAHGPVLGSSRTGVATFAGRSAGLSWHVDDPSESQQRTSNVPHQRPSIPPGEQPCLPETSASLASGGTIKNQIPVTAMAGLESMGPRDGEWPS